MEKTYSDLWSLLTIRRITREQMGDGCFNCCGVKDYIDHWAWELLEKINIEHFKLSHDIADEDLKEMEIILNEME